MRVNFAIEGPPVGKARPRDFRSRRIMPDWIYAALFLAILALGIMLVGEL